MSTPTNKGLSYPNWDLDYRVFIRDNQGKEPILRTQARHFLEVMKRKQCLFEGDRSHPRIVVLDKMKFTYDGWQRDFERAEELHAWQRDQPLPVVKPMDLDNEDSWRKFNKAGEEVSNLFDWQLEEHLMGMIGKEEEQDAACEHSKCPSLRDLFESAQARNYDRGVPVDVDISNCSWNGREFTKNTRASISNTPPAVGRDDDAEAECCVVCMESRRSHAFVPCGHRIICGDCAWNRKFLRLCGELKCPFCRTKASSIIKVHL